MAVAADSNYSRIYHTVVDDEKFQGVFDNDRHWALYVRLLMLADAAYPASAALPRSAKRSSLAVLADATIIDLLPGDRFKVRGLDAERQKRCREQMNGGVVRALGAQRDDHGRFLPVPSVDPGLVASGGATSGSQRVQLAETSRVETRRDEQDVVLNDDFFAAVKWIEALTKSMFGHSRGSRVWEVLASNTENFGGDRICEVLSSVAGGIEHPNAAQLVFGADKVLHPLSPHPVQDSAVAERRATEEHIEACRKLHYEITEEEIAEHVRRGECAFRKPEELA